jgi:hypothetical protein
MDTILCPECSYQLERSKELFARQRFYKGEIRIYERALYLLAQNYVRYVTGLLLTDDPDKKDEMIDNIMKTYILMAEETDW